MDWTALFEMLKGVFGNDPTMVLLLTVAFFFLRQIWPETPPASSQILQGYAERIREALKVGNLDGARQLAEAGVDRAKAALVAESEPKVGGFLDIIKNLFGNGNLMSLLLIGGVVLLLMLTKGGGCAMATAKAADPIHTSWSIDREQDRFVELDGAVGTVRPVGAPIVFCGDQWSWADQGTVGELGVADRRGFLDADAGTGGDVDGAGVPQLGDGGVCAAADCGRCSCPSRRAAVGASPAVSRLAFRRGQPVRNAGRGVVRAAGRVVGALRWLRLPGRPFARLLGRR